MKSKSKINLFILLLLSSIFTQITAQDYSSPHRFVDNYYFRSRDIQVDENIIYGKAENFRGKTEILDLDLYYPSPAIDPLKKKPLLMLVHGGSTGDNSRTEKYCPLFAQRGFVVANINRRKGSKGSGETELLKQAYRAVQDAHAALRHLVHNAQKYGIDTSAIFVGGVSGGAMATIGITYMRQPDFDSKYPDITSSLGRIDNSTNEINTNFKVRGVVDMWGQIEDTSLISDEEALNIPIIIFHSTADSSRSPYKKALELAARYKNHGGCYQLHTSTGTGHTEGISKYYIAQQSGCFLKSILSNSCNSFETEVDNENIKCSNSQAREKLPKQRLYFELDQSLIKEYAGVYKIEKEKIVIGSENGHLFIIESDDGTKTELFPESQTDFFLEEDNIQFSFNKNAKGKIYGLTLFIDAKAIKAKKIK
ncbi:MAG: prolyl oligopeptidase family serine peptidase [Marinilabiliaceae bacterium]|jgi:predicted peptidase|nr:prolyl oligopeptidase family serine peptidase [Marinilabiliaceae bacterium]